MSTDIWTVCSGNICIDHVTVDKMQKSGRSGDAEAIAENGI
ncbi:MAG: hypothetical protein ACXV8U_19515 [Methylobacter sp.]